MKVKRLIKDGDIILDGTGTRYEKEKEAFAKLEHLEFVQELIEKIMKKGVLHLHIDKISEYYGGVYYDFEEDCLVCLYHYESEARGEEWDTVVDTLYLSDYGETWREYREEDGEKYTYWYN